MVLSWTLSEADLGLTVSSLSRDIKPNNVFVDYNENPAGAIAVKQVQIGDLEMGSVIPPCLNVRGARLGNLMWRSPEAHAASHINLPSDMFSFGLVVSVPNSISGDGNAVLTSSSV